MASPPVFRRARTTAISMAVAVLALAACSSSNSPHSSTDGFSVSSQGASPGGFRGTTLTRPITLSRADLADTFTSSQGATTTLGSLQTGRLMVLYFGYTHCPDVCPTTMADLGLALRQLPSIEQAHIQVVFVTSDPVRDTPAVIKSWLSNFDSGLTLPFVGLTASIAQIDKVAASVGIPLEPPKTQANGTITVEHGAQALAFASGKASVLWLAGTTPGDYQHDLRKLVVKVGKS